MPEMQLPEIKMYYEEHGTGAPILCIHGTSSSARTWAPAFDDLSRLGRLIAYDRRGCTRTERPRPYLKTSVSDHADDAAALLESLAATPAVVIGRSYGGEIALDLALRYPGHVRALALLEPAVLSLTPDGRRWDMKLRSTLQEVARERGVNAVAEAFLREVLDHGAWDQFPDAMKQMFVDNGEAILAEVMGGAMQTDAETLTRIQQPALLVSAAASAPIFHEVDAVIAAAIPNSRTAVVAGDHLISASEPAVLRFIEEVLSEA